MNSKIKSALQYLIMISITVGLLWFSLRGIPMAEGESKSEFIWNAWQRSDKIYLLLVVFVLMLSHVIRADRWKMLLVPTGYKIKLGSSLLSLMIGYLVNMVIPRGGEVSRCYNLYKLEKTPIEVSFGTVVVDRIADLVCLIFFVALAFLAEWTKLMAFIETLNFSGSNSGSRMGWVIVIAVLLLLLGVAAFFVLRKNEKVKKIFGGFKDGLMAVFKLQNKGLFVFYSIAIWGLYFMMSYLVLLAFPETKELGLSAVLTLFALGAIAMAAPLPGGAGSYHALVPVGLVMLYNLPQGQAVAFVFVFHAWQTLISLVGGVISLIISYVLIRWKKAQEK